MKKINLILVMAISIVSLFSSCSSTKKAVKANKAETGIEVEIVDPFDNKYSNDTNNAFRAVYKGVSLDWNEAKNIAIMQCQSAIIMKIKGKIKTALSEYVNQYAINNKDNRIITDINKSFESYHITYAEGELANIRQVNSHCTQNLKTNEYSYWVAMEIDKNDIVEYNKNIINEAVANFEENILKDKKAEINYNRDKFINYLNKHVFNEN